MNEIGQRVVPRPLNETKQEYARPARTVSQMFSLGNLTKKQKLLGGVLVTLLFGVGLSQAEPHDCVSENLGLADTLCMKCAGVLRRRSCV